MRQDDDAPLCGGARNPHHGQDLLRRPRRDPAAARETADRHGVPELRAVPAHDGRPEHRLRPERARGAGQRGQPSHRRRRRDGATQRARRAIPAGALRRPAATGRARARAGDRAGTAPARRAARQSRRETARGDALLHSLATTAPGHHDALRHPRPVREHDHVEPGRRHVRRMHPPDRQRRGHLSPAGDPRGGDVHRPGQSDAGPGRRSTRRHGHHRHRAREVSLRHPKGRRRRQRGDCGGAAGGPAPGHRLGPRRFLGPGRGPALPRQSGRLSHRAGRWHDHQHSRAQRRRGTHGRRRFRAGRFRQGVVAAVRRWLLALPALLVVVVFVVIPYLNIVVMSFRTPSATAIHGPGFTIANYAHALTDSLYLGLLADTLLYALATTSISLVLAFPVAFHLARTESRWRGLLYAGVLSPLLTGVVIRCFGWIILLANDGLVNQGLGLFGLGPYRFINGVGVTIALVHVFLPFMILPIMNAIQS